MVAVGLNRMENSPIGAQAPLRPEPVSSIPALDDDSNRVDVVEESYDGYDGELDGTPDSIGSEYEDDPDDDDDEASDADDHDSYQFNADDDLPSLSCQGQGDSNGTDDSQDQQADVVLRFCYFMATEDFDDGQASSTLLVYFSAICGLSGQDGSEFARPATYTTHLSGLIYCTRLLLLEGTLPRVAHEYIQLPARPRRGQLELLSEVRRDKMCDGSLSPLGEFLSLVAYGVSLSRTDGPAFLFEWSDDGEEIAWMASTA